MDSAGKKQDSAISDEVRQPEENSREHYEPPFLEVDVVGGAIGDK